jgi:hypothetical protein
MTRTARFLIASFVLVLVRTALVVYDARLLQSESFSESGRVSQIQTPKISGSKNGSRSRIGRDEAIEETNIDDRPWMVVHVGLPKTGTTTIQAGLKDLSQRLARVDNVYFIGCVLSNAAISGDGTSSNNSNSSNSITVNNDGPNVTMFRMKDFVPPSKPTSEFIDILKSHHRNKRNVVISSEHLSQNLEDSQHYWKQIFQNVFLSSKNCTEGSTGEGVDGDEEEEEHFLGFKIKVVVTYRHFFQWLHSYWSQQHSILLDIDPPSRFGNRNTTIPHNSSTLYPYRGYLPGIIEFVEWFLDNIVEYKGPNVTHASYSRVFPNQNRIEKGKGLPTSHFSIWSFLKWSSRPELYDRVDAFDMHQQALYPLSDDPTANNNNNHTSEKWSLFPDFVCQMLPTATKTCRYLDEDTSDSDYKKHVDPGHAPHPANGETSGKRHKRRPVASTSALPDCCEVVSNPGETKQRHNPPPEAMLG